MTDKSGKTPPVIAMEDRVTEGDRLFSPSAARNRDPIRDVLLEAMPEKGKVLEIGGGTGEHAVHIAQEAPGLVWLTGDPDPASNRSIAAWIAASGLANLRGPHGIDVAASDWGVDDEARFDGIVSINMIHIAPFEAAVGLFEGAGRYLVTGGKLFLYGAFSFKGEHSAPSNAAFDASLKSRDARWGVRDLEQDLLPLAQKNALSLERVVDMPANNFSILFRKD